MHDKDAQFLNRLLATFKVEAEDHLRTISSGLLVLEKNPDGGRRAEIIESVFRAMHSLKGAARSVNLGKIEGTCQELESVCAEIKRNERSLTKETLELLNQGLDALSRLLGNETALTGAVAPPSDAKAPAAPAAAATTVRVSTAKLNAVLLQAEELVSLKLAAEQRVTELREFQNALGDWGQRFARENSTSKAELGALEGKVKTLRERYERDQRSSSGMIEQLLEDMKRATMLPFATLTELLPKLVRDLARDRAKDVELAMAGTDVEIDRRILEEIKDPLIHLVRNCIDHGIEAPSVREAKGKPRGGKVSIAISQRDGNKIEVLISDDGMGIDADGVKAAAQGAGVISRAEAGSMGEDDALALVFRSGVSTSPAVTELSGRGLGLAIVREKVEKLGGQIALQSLRGAGTTFRMELPLTLANFRGLLVRSAGNLYVIPLRSVERVLRVARAGVRTVENRETIETGGEVVPLRSLASLLGLTPTVMSADPTVAVVVVVVTRGKDRIAISVDDILGAQEVLFKTLGRQLVRVRNISGATVLNSGQVVPILSTPDLVKTAIETPGPAAAAEQGGKSDGKRKSVLIAEDSITSRTLLKNILEGAGYRVRTAVDGMEAYATLKTEVIDLLVSDIDMPRMNGIELTAKIRSDRELAQLPVVLVTANEARETREMGISVGANAYIVKSSFDQSDLLEVVGRLT